MFKLLTIFTIVAVGVIAHDQNSTTVPVQGMQRLFVYGNNATKLDLVKQYEEYPDYDFVQVPLGDADPVDVMVTASAVKGFKKRLRAKGLRYQVVNKDVSQLLSPPQVIQRSFWDQNWEIPKPVFLQSFPRYNEIKSYIENLEKTHADVVKSFSIGKSSEGREILGVKISTGGTNKSALFIDAGIHAREWMAPATAMYTIKELVENAENRHIFENIDIYIVPLLNPDGYEFTHTGPKARLWRKTRSHGLFCNGVDANRNFGYKWMTVGASNNPCSHTYAGPQPFSEPETRAVRDFILDRKDHIKVYLSLHSYGQYILYPWGYKKETPANEPILKCVAGAAELELSKVRGTRYKIGSSTNLLYPAAGGSDDWAMGVAGIELAYTMELPGGYWGFAPPASEIPLVGRETLEAFKIFAKYVDDKICNRHYGLYF